MVKIVQPTVISMNLMQLRYSEEATEIIYKFLPSRLA